MPNGRRLLIALVALAAAGAIGWGVLVAVTAERLGRPAGAERIVLLAGGVPRSALVVPAAGEGPAPVVIAFHGLGGNARGLLERLGDLPERSGATVVLPDALPCPAVGLLTCWPAEAGAPTGPEFAVFDAVLADVADRWPVDTTRVTALGYSNGAGWAVRLLLDRPEAIQGAIVVAGFDPTRGFARDGAGRLAFPLEPITPSTAPAPAVRRPAAIVLGDADGTVPPAVTRGLVERLRALGWRDDDLRVDAVAGADHLDPRLLDEDRLLGHLAWLTARRPAGR